MPTVAKKRKKPSATKRRKARVAGSPSTITLFGRRYTKKMCSLTKADATAKAKARRATGKGAAVKKNAGGTGYCLYTRG